MDLDVSRKKDDDAHDPEATAGEPAGGGSAENPVVKFFVVIGSVVIGFFDFIGSIVEGALLLVYGLFTKPAETVADVKQSIRRAPMVAGGYARWLRNGVRAAYKDFMEGVPPALRYLIVVLLVALVFAVVNRSAARSRQRTPLEVAKERWDLGDSSRYRKRLVDNLDEYHHDAPTPAPRSWFQRIRDYVSGTATSTPSPRRKSHPTSAPRWVFDEDTNEWRWARGDKASDDSQADDSAASGDSGSSGDDRPSRLASLDDGYSSPARNSDRDDDPSSVYNSYNSGQRERPRLGSTQYGGGDTEDQGGQIPQNEDAPDGDDENALGGGWGTNPPPSKPRRRHGRALPVDDDDLERAIDKSVKDDMDEAAQLKRKIELIKERDRLSELRSELGELYQRRKLRQQIQNEYEWADEQEVRRELERERQREKWRRDDVTVARRDAAAGWTSDASAKSPQGLPATGTLDARAAGSGALDPAFGGGKNCEEPPVIVEPYGSFVSNQVSQPDYAYVTYVSSREYVQGAAVLMHSVAVTGSQYARAVLVTTEISQKDRELLGTLAQVIEIERVQHPHYISNAHYRDTFSKLRIWELAMFKKVVYIDVDVILLRNIDDLFDLSEWSVPMDAEQSRYSTGMMVCEPSLKTFDDMMEKLQTTHVSMELPDLLFLKEYFDNKEQDKPAAPATPSWYSYGPPPPPPKRINIIPRWYQVYQEEFGSEYHTYLTARKQRITIYDRRIHGIHYPGNDKPWHRFAAYWAKFKPHFCKWSQADEFVYTPKYMWYVHFAWMKSTLRRAKSAVNFDFEGGGGEIKLEDWAKEERKKMSPPAFSSPRNSWGQPPSTGSDYSKYGSGYSPRSDSAYSPYASGMKPSSSAYSPYGSPSSGSSFGTKKSSAYSSGSPLSSASGNTVVTAAPNSAEDWMPATCVIRRAHVSFAGAVTTIAPRTTLPHAVSSRFVRDSFVDADSESSSGSDSGSDSAGGALDMDDSSNFDSDSGGSDSEQETPRRGSRRSLQEAAWFDDSGSDSGSGSADGSGSDSGSDSFGSSGDSDPWSKWAAGRLPTPSAKPLGDVVIDLSTLDPFAAKLPQAWSGVSLEPYLWVISWCTPGKLHAASDSTCGMDAYVNQYSGGQCRTNFAEGFSMHLLTKPSTGSNGVEVLGVILRTSIELQFPQRRKVMEVAVRCDWSMSSETTAKLDARANASTVEVDTVRPPHDRRYTLRLRSRCACAGGCGQAKPKPPPSVSEASTPVIGKKKATRAPTSKISTLTPAAKSWAIGAFGDLSKPFGSASAFSRCIGASVAVCLEEPGCDYIVSQARCTPSIATEWVTYRQPRDKAFCNCSHVGGNAVDQVTLEQCYDKAAAAGANVVNYLPWPAGAKSVPTPAPGQAPTAGCYFKRCPGVDLLRGDPTVKVAQAADETGFYVYFHNPLYMDAKTAVAFDKSRQRTLG